MPPLPLGSYDVTVVNPPWAGPGPGSATLAASLGAVDLPDPNIQEILPPSAPVAGGTVVRIFGAGLDASTKVCFGADPATGLGGTWATQVTFIAPGELDAVVPAASADGAVSLLVTNDLGQASAPAVFEYVANVAELRAARVAAAAGRRLRRGDRLEGVASDRRRPRRRNLELRARASGGGRRGAPLGAAGGVRARRRALNANDPNTTYPQANDRAPGADRGPPRSRR